MHLPFDSKAWLTHPLIAPILCGLCALLAFGQIIINVKHYYIYKEVSQPSKLIKKIPHKSSPNLVTALRLPLFGQYVPHNLADGNIKRSSLNITVVGILYAKQEDESQVILRTENGRENMFHIDDHLPGGAIIKRIMPQGVVLEHQGELESLILPKNELIFEPPPKPMQP